MSSKIFARAIFCDFVQCSRACEPAAVVVALPTMNARKILAFAFVALAGVVVGVVLDRLVLDRYEMQSHSNGWIVVLDKRTGIPDIWTAGGEHKTPKPPDAK